jgi:TrmH family RNA methyltransferase
MIVSRQNQKIKNIRRLRRCKGDLAVLEGPHLVLEAIAAGLELETVLVTPDFLASSEGHRVRQEVATPLTEVAPALLDELSDADSPKGVLGVAALPRPSLDALPQSRAGLYLFLDGLQDPGNLGSLARVAEAFGATALILSPGAAHPNHPRALRASAGSLLRLPTAMRVSALDLATFLAPLRPTWVALVPRGGVSVLAATLHRPLVLAVGAEGPGLSDEVTRLAAVHLTIPIADSVESLNATVAATVVLWELSRPPRAELG